MTGGERYFRLTPLNEAIQMMKERFSCDPKSITIPVSEACGRITSEAIISPSSMPPTYLSAMDGIAVKSKDTLGATDQHPIIMQDAVRVNTGNIIPDGYDAVIMIEDVEISGDTYSIISPVHPWQHIRPVGEDIAASEMIIPRWHQIRPEDIGALASYGITRVSVVSLKVGLLPTGSEIVPIGTIPKPGQMIESNMHMAAALIRSLGGDVHHYPIVPDDPDRIRSSVADAVRECDIVLISAGSSKGTKDYSATILSELGEILVHGIAIKPAKPVIIGEIDKKPVIGVPGYPIACHTILRELITPLLGWYHLKIPESDCIKARVASTLHSDIGTDEFVLVSAGNVHNSWVAVPLSRGSGVQMSMVRSNGYLKIPASSEGIESGMQTDIHLTVSRDNARKAVLIAGSHDPSLDYLADLVRKDDILLSSTHIGSMGGLLTLKKEDCHLAPMHLLSDDGDYNIPQLRRYIPDKDLVLICVAEREQGVVSRNNYSLDEITKRVFINRQRGSGTRVLLDYLLKQKEINPDQIEGYSREVTTHLAVCIAILSGDAEIGLAVYSAAKTFGLSFVPIGTERYEMATSVEMLENDIRIQKVFDAIRSDQFKAILERLGGYRTAETGCIRYVR